MIVSVHQPQYLPWLGYFHKISCSDVFVFLDNVQYKKREFQNRNKIRVKDGSIWLTVPVKVKGRYFQKIRDVEIESGFRWRQDHWKALEINYRKAKHFTEFSGFFKKIYDRQWHRLMDVSVEIIKIFLDVWAIKTKIYFESDLNIKGRKTERIVEICKKVGADKYLSGVGAKAYLDGKRFEDEGIGLIWQNFRSPVYKQVYDGFVPNLAAVDILFNLGKEAEDVLKSI